MKIHLKPCFGRARENAECTGMSLFAAQRFDVRSERAQGPSVELGQLNLPATNITYY